MIEALSRDTEDLQLENHQPKRSNRELLRQLEEAKRRHSAEKPMLTAELTAAAQQPKDLNRQLQREKHLRMQEETDKLEAVEIAETLLKKTGDTQKVSEERSAVSRLLSAELRSAKDRLEVLEMQQTLRREKELRIQAEAETLTDFRIQEAFCKEFEQRLQTEKKLRAEAERSRLEAVKMSEALFQSFSQGHREAVS